MKGEMERYYSQEGIRQSTVGKIIRRIERGTPAEIGEHAARELKNLDSKNTYELDGVSWAIEDITRAFWIKVRSLRFK